MKLFMPLIIALVTAAVPAVAAEQTGAAVPALQLADTGDFASQKAEYEARARHEMDIWRERVTVAGAQAHEALDRAWVVTKEQWADLQQATADTWERSRVAFEQAAQRMKEEWRENHPDDSK